MESTDNKTKEKPRSWRSVVACALVMAGGEAHLSELNPIIKRIREDGGTKLSKSWQATVRRELQIGDYFTQDKYKSGVWRLLTPDEVDGEYDPFA
jgi:hypothetical protein